MSSSDCCASSSTMRPSDRTTHDPHSTHKAHSRHHSPTAVVVEGQGPASCGRCPTASQCTCKVGQPHEKMGVKTVNDGVRRHLRDDEELNVIGLDQDNAIHAREHSRTKSEESGCCDRDGTDYPDVWTTSYGALPVWACEFLAELFGTAFLVFFGTGSVAAAVISGAQTGLWQVAVVWGWGVSIAIFCVGHVSGAHLNPSISFAFALIDHKDFGWRRFGYYVLAQFVGAFLGSLLVWSLFSGAVAHYEGVNNMVRGQPGSERTAMMFGEYFPNPASYPNQNEVIGIGQAFWAEMLGTAFLAFVIFSVTAPCNNVIPPNFAPLFIGFTVSIIISLIAPLTQAGLNPARDFSPRLLALILGWGDIAIPGPRNGFWIYLLAPMLGAPIGGFLANVCIQRPCKSTEACYELVACSEKKDD